MGGEQAASVLATVRRDGIEAQGERWPEAEQQRSSAPSASSTRRQGNPYYATARLWDDGVIDPADTRRMLGLALDVVAPGPAPAPESYGVFRM